MNGDVYTDLPPCLVIVLTRMIMVKEDLISVHPESLSH